MACRQADTFRLYITLCSTRSTNILHARINSPLIFHHMIIWVTYTTFVKTSIFRNLTLKHNTLLFCSKWIEKTTKHLGTLPKRPSAKRGFRGGTSSRWSRAWEICCSGGPSKTLPGPGTLSGRAGGGKEAAWVGWWVGVWKPRERWLFFFFGGVKYGEVLWSGVLFVSRCF